MQEVTKIKTTLELEMFLLEHGEQIIDVLGSQVDRIERNIKVSCSSAVHFFFLHYENMTVFVI